MCYLSNDVDDVTRDLKMKITHENNVTGILEKENKCQLVAKITLSTRKTIWSKVFSSVDNDGVLFHNNTN